MDELDRILVRFHPTQLMRDVGYYSTLKSNREAKAQLTAYSDKKELEAQTNAVAWAVGVVDELHIDIEHHNSDRTFKGIKNTIRDRYKAATGVDPAPRYPVKAELKRSQDVKEKN